MGIKYLLIKSLFPLYIISGAASLSAANINDSAGDPHGLPPEEIKMSLSDYLMQFPGQTFIGIYDSQKNIAYLSQAIGQKVWLLKGSKKTWQQGWHIGESDGKLIRGAEIDDEIIDFYNSNNLLIPRQYSISDNIDDKDYFTSHDYLLDLVDGRYFVENFFGFSLNVSSTPERKLKFIWVSGTLNNRDENGRIIFDAKGNPLRKRGALVKKDMRTIIKNAVYRVDGSAVLLFSLKEEQKKAAKAG